MEHDKFVRITELTPAYDGRPASQGGLYEWRTPNMLLDDGTQSTDYGVGSVQLRMVLKGPKGAVQFVVGTDWYPPHVQEEFATTYDKRSYFSPLLDRKPRGMDVGYHSPRPMYEGHLVLTDECKYLDGRPCYYDGSTLRAEEWVEILLKEGSEGIWVALEKEYQRVFEDDKYVLHDELFLLRQAAEASKEDAVVDEQDSKDEEIARLREERESLKRETAALRVLVNRAERALEILARRYVSYLGGTDRGPHSFAHRVIDEVYDLAIAEERKEKEQ